MISFHRVTLDDKDYVKKQISSREHISCEYGFGNIFTYNSVIDIYIADVEGCLVTKCGYPNFDYYCFPIGFGDKSAAAKAVVEEAERVGKKAYFFGMTEEDKNTLENLFPGKFQIEANRDSFDYVYSSSDLINLMGKKYQPKRNHISFFKRNLNWKYERITKESIPECLAMSEKWLTESKSEYTDDLEREIKIIRCAFENYDELGYVGGLIRVDGEVIAYAMGEELSKDTFCTHIEKAYSDIRGAYAMINQQFAENELSGYDFINREDDVGAQNLRKAKLSYAPNYLFEKYETRIN